MGKLFQIIIGLLVCTILLVAGGIGVVYHYRSEIMTAGIEKLMSEALKTNVSFGNLDINPDDGHFSIRDTTIKNPSGFSDRNALTIGEITLLMNQENTTEDITWIKEFSLKNINILYEYDEETSKSNLSMLGGDNIRNTTNNSNQPEMSETKKKVDAEEDDEEDKKTLRLDEFNFQSVKITVLVDGREFSIPLPDIVVRDVGNGESLPPDEFFGGIIKKIPEKTWKEIDEAKEALKKAGAEKASEAFDTLSELQNSNSIFDTLFSRLKKKKE